MPIDFVNLIKGRVTQTLLMALFERGGYRVTRLGIEELFDEVKHLDLQQYIDLNLPLQLRRLPDLLVVDLDMTTAFLVEVKYRRHFDDAVARALHDELDEQRRDWPQANAALMVSQPMVSGGSFHQDFIRVIAPNQTALLTDSTLSPADKWEQFHHIQRVFKGFNNQKYIIDVQQSADKLTTALKDLANL